MMTCGRKKFCVIWADTVCCSRDVAAEFDTETVNEQTNFGTSIFAQTPVNTSPLDSAGAIRFGVVGKEGSRYDGLGLVATLGLDRVLRIISTGTAVSASIPSILLR
jgi:hypothetical protein